MEEEVKVLVSGKDGKIYQIVPSESVSCTLCCFYGISICSDELQEAFGRKTSCISRGNYTGELLGTRSNCCHYKEMDSSVSRDTPFDYSKLNEGDRVLIKKPSKEEMGGWDDVWVDKMDKMADTVVTVKYIHHNGFTVKGDCKTYTYPPCCIVHYA